MEHKIKGRCKGCQYLTYNEKKNIMCIIRYEEVLRQTCPCRDCIIKMMCEEMCHQRYLKYYSFNNKSKTKIIKSLEASK